jgi:hypothetical protein
VKVGGGSEIKIKDFILYFSHLALPLNKVGCVSTMPVKNIRFSFALSSTCTTFAACRRLAYVLFVVAPPQLLSSGLLLLKTHSISTP